MFYFIFVILKSLQVVLPELASIRITAYEESGKFIGHRVLPVVGLCPGYRHVNLRTELGQPLPLATVFLLVVVKDYVPDGLSDFAEALANPIKYQNELEKRAQQLAVLTDEPPGEIVEGIEDQKKNSVTKLVQENKLNGSPTQRSSVTVTSTSLDLPTEGDATQTFPSLTGIVTEQNSLIKSAEVKEEKVEEIVAEPLDKILENKLVKEKKMELDKKLDTLRKKHEKKKMTLQSQKSGEFGGEKKSKLMNMKLLRRISNTNMYVSLAPTRIL